MAESETKSRGYTYGDPHTIRMLILRDGPACFYCGHAFSATMQGWSHMAIDHVIPQSTGQKVEWLHEPENLRLSCKECNSAKGGKLLSFKQLAAFRLRRHLTRERDEEWVRWQHQLLRELSEKQPAHKLPDLKSFARRLAGELIEALNSSWLTSDAAPYTRSAAGNWIRFHRQLGGSGETWEWYFCTDHYQLQPHTLGWSNDPFAPIDNFDLMGYFQHEMRCKYVEPFADADKGVAIIAREVRAFEAMWALERRLDAVGEAGGECPGAAGGNA